jgi:hypothetical protein
MAGVFAAMIFSKLKEHFSFLLHFLDISFLIVVLAFGLIAAVQF